MKDYSLFDIEDFVMDEDFIRWVHDNGKADNEFWANWLDRNPHKHLVIAEARKILESVGSQQPIVPGEVIDVEIEKLLAAIHVPNLQLAELRRNRFPVWKYFTAAVFLTVILGAAIWTFTGKQKMPAKFSYAGVTAARGMVENVNTSKTSIRVALPDGSTVQLGADSRISYESGFDSLPTRDIYLSGQAFFTVKKNAQHPFRVFANEIVAKVLGTSFSVRSFDKDTIIQVTVSTGKVSVYSQGQVSVHESAAPNKLGGIIITPNQQLVYAKASQEFQKLLLENPAMINTVSVNKTMAYEDAPIDKVFDDLGRDYGINIVYDNEVLKKCTVTADLANESFYHKLDLICRAIGARYEVIDAQVVIQSNGCQ